MGRIGELSLHINANLYFHFGSRGWPKMSCWFFHWCIQNFLLVLPVFHRWVQLMSGFLAQAIASHSDLAFFFKSSVGKCWGWRRFSASLVNRPWWDTAMVGRVVAWYMPAKRHKLSSSAVCLQSLLVDKLSPPGVPARYVCNHCLWTSCRPGVSSVSTPGVPAWCKHIYILKKSNI